MCIYIHVYTWKVFPMASPWSAWSIWLAEAPLFIMRLLRLLLISAAGPYDPAEVGCLVCTIKPSIMDGLDDKGWHI
jgi:hypothetical protein